MRLGPQYTPNIRHPQSHNDGGQRLISDGTVSKYKYKISAASFI